MNKQEAMIALFKKTIFFAELPAELQSDKECIFFALKRGLIAIKDVSEQISDDRDFFIEALEASAIKLNDVPPKFKEDKGIIVATVNDVETYQGLSKELKNDKDVAVKAASIGAYACLPEKLRLDRDVVIAGVQNDSSLYLELPDKFKHDRGVAMATAQHPFAFECLIEEFKHDKEIALAALTFGNSSFEDFPDELKLDRDIALKALEKGGHALEYFPETLKQDHEMISAAVIDSYWAKRFIPDSVRADRQFMEKLFLKSLEKDPLHLETEFVSPTESVLLAAFGCNSIESFSGVTGKDEDSEAFLDLIDDNWQITKMSPGDSKEVGNCVSITCYHSLSGPSSEPERGTQTLRFFILQFQAAPVHMTLQEVYDEDGDCYGRDAMFFGYHDGEPMVCPMSDNDHCSEMIGDLEDSDNIDWEEED